MDIKRIFTIYITVVFLLGSIAIADINDGLIAYYPFNGNANDESGNGNHGVEHNEPAYSEGMFGQAIKFNGQDNYIDLPTIQEGLQEISVSFWVKADSSNEFSKHSRIIALRKNYHIEVTFWDDNQIGFSNYIYANKKYFSNQWIFIAINVNSLNTELYIFDNDGLKEHSVLNVNMLKDDNYNNTIGSNDDRNDGFLKGQLDDLKIYNRALSAAEIKELYNVGFSSLPDITSSCRATYLNGKLHIPFVDVLDPFTGSKTSTYNVDMQLLENRTPLTFELRKAVQQ